MAFLGIGIAAASPPQGNAEEIIPDAKYAAACPDYKKYSQFIQYVPSYPSTV
jgi:hypothetical protein